jgi:molybdate transport system substrate-binding protein
MSAYKDSKMRFMRRSMLCLYFLLGISPFAFANNHTIHLAVSSTIKGPLLTICQKFSQSTGMECKITTAPTGHLYAHIMHGMAYDLFLSSDETYVQGLVNAQKADPESRFVVAKGRVVLWSADPNATAESLYQSLIAKHNIAIVIANPGASTYGGAAKEVLQGYSLWNHIQGRLIYSKNIAHAYELVTSKKAPLGFVSLAQLSAQTRLRKRYWEPDPKSYKPVLHEVITLKPNEHQAQTAAFLAYLSSQESCQVFQEAGFNCSLG